MEIHGPVRLRRQVVGVQPDTIVAAEEDHPVVPHGKRSDLDPGADGKSVGYSEVRCVGDVDTRLLPVEAECLTHFSWREGNAAVRCPMVTPGAVHGITLGRPPAHQPPGGRGAGALNRSAGKMECAKAEDSGENSENMGGSGHFGSPSDLPASSEHR